VVFDTTHRLTAFDMPLGIWVGINNYGMPCFFGCVLLRDETVRSYSWAIKVVNQELISVCIVWFFIQIVLWPLGFFSEIILVLLICDMTSFFYRRLCSYKKIMHCLGYTWWKLIQITATAKYLWKWMQAPCASLVFLLFTLILYNGLDTLIMDDYIFLLLPLPCEMFINFFRSSSIL
jgi:hypothetical protein